MAEVAERQLDFPAPMGTFMTWQHLQLRRRGGWMIVLAVGLAGVGAVWPPYPRGEAAQPSVEQPAKANAPLPLQGAISCASMACHNGFGPNGSKGSEYTTWIGGEDKHTRAFLVLSNERSQGIEKRLANNKKATEDALCLNCHVHPQAGQMSSETLDLVQGDGVSCESCHGAAGRWRTVHYLAGWQQKSVEEKKRYGMQPTKDLVERAKACAHCHVGDGPNDVNHDLIAAGHPRLNFEFSAYHDLMPKHWDEAAEKQTYPDLEARLWVLGQLVSAQTALELLAYRAESQTRRADSGLAKPWPEFAEYQCYACHHDLEPVSWRQQRERALGKGPGRPLLGSAAWGTWYFAMLPSVTAGQSKQLPSLSELREAMRLPLPPRNEIRDKARGAAKDLEPLIHGTVSSRYQVRQLFQSIFAPLPQGQGFVADQLARENWDGAAQVYLALAALYHAQADQAPASVSLQWKTLLATMRRQLEFPRNIDSPEEKTYRDQDASFLRALEIMRRQAP